MVGLFNKLLSTKYKPLNKILISKSKLKYNYETLSSLSHLKIAPVLKSNAYGHGIALIGKALDPLNPPFLCVDSIYEGYELLKTGIKSPILITGYINPENLNNKKLPFSYTAYDKNTLAGIHKYQPHSGIHIFVDTGMHREGVSLSDLPDLLKYLSNHPSINIEGLMSHFAKADDPQNPNTKKQILEFKSAQDLFKKAGINPKWIHISASSGLINQKKLSPGLGNLARVGIALYGIYPTRQANLKPVLKLLTTISQIKYIRKGEKIGYDFTYTAKQDTKIAVLPIGYNDGININLSNKGFVYIKNQPCSIIGKISMNITVVDVSNIKNIKADEIVEVYSDSPKRVNSIANSSKIAGCIPYELLVHLHPSTRREPS